MSSSSSTGKHSLLSLGNAVSDIVDFINLIKNDIEELKAGKSKLEVLEQTVNFLGGEIAKIVTGEDNPYSSLAVPLNTSSDSSDTSTSTTTT